ncbi:MAG TPA: HAMP domain-containing sensor histidine kinase [Candidatus Binatia bacterium]|nr:HAMP domain-containing sensor histidine kinase [Candidatus Binatia bacterium]
MNPLNGPDLVAAALYTLTALVWLSVTAVFWKMDRRARPRTAVVRATAALTMLMTSEYFLGLLAVAMPESRSTGRSVHIARDVIDVIAVAVLRHVLALAAIREPPARSAWLAVNYGAAILVAIVIPFLPSPTVEQTWFESRLVLAPYFIVMLGLALREMVRLGGRGLWRAGGLGGLRRADAAVLGTGLVVLVVVALVVGAGRWRAQTALPMRLLDVGIGLGLAVPFVVRTPSDMLPRLLTNGTMIAVAAATWVGGHALVSARPALRGIVDVVAVLFLVVALGPGRAWLSAAIYHVVLRRGRGRREKLRGFLSTLSPELGVVECCERAAMALGRELRLPGMAILLRTGDAAVYGSFAIAPVARAWPREVADDLLPTHPFGAPNFWDLPVSLQDALNESNVVGVVPITSPRGPWGHLFATAGHVAAIYTDEDIQTCVAFADQLALVLDAAELIARAVAVERSLAHAEKLAAIGETAARIAHDMRNPVAAARSLAAQLAREPGSTFRAEHDVILGELERVERQVASLLRFARREELHCERLDLGAFVAATVEAFRARCDAARIALDLELPEGVTVSADRDKLRPVVVNLLENAIDALGEVEGPRCLSVTVANGHATATLSVRDTGPGAPPDAVPRLFEPFFSLKEHGTGLGLAIAKHTIEAHGGRIGAERGAPSGMIFRLELPAAGPR